MVAITLSDVVRVSVRVPGKALPAPSTGTSAPCMRSWSWRRVHLGDVSRLWRRSRTETPAGQMRANGPFFTPDVCEWSGGANLSDADRVRRGPARRDQVGVFDVLLSAWNSRGRCRRKRQSGMRRVRGYGASCGLRLRRCSCSSQQALPGAVPRPGSPRGRGRWSRPAAPHTPFNESFLGGRCWDSPFCFVARRLLKV